MISNFFAHAGIERHQLRFQWAANDGSFYQACTHMVKDKETYDWTVQCGQRVFDVHFFIKEIQRDVQPAKTIEVIYYIVGKSPSSQGVWIHLEKQSPLYGLVFHQSVDNDASDLILNYKP